MSAAKMVADSTQAEPTDTADGKKRKKKVKKTNKKVNLPEDEDSDLDLKKDLEPIGHYIKSRSKMVDEMFRAVRGASLQRALPDLLKSIPLDELRQLCLEQLEVMSKKRIRRILAGEESGNISSSGTEDETTDEEQVQQDGPDGQSIESTKEEISEIEAHPADSTSVHQDSEPEKTEEVPPAPAAEGFVASFQQVEIKQEPLSSAEEDMDQGRNDDAVEDDEDEEDEDEEEDDDPEENYTSGSEDGELVRREEPVVKEKTMVETVQIKQEVMSDAEEGTSGTSQLKEGKKEDDQEDDDEEDMEDEEEASGGDKMDQMELLELEMRARAIKAMLSSQDDQDNG